MTEQELEMWQHDLAMIEMLRKENEKLEEKINKVIEYIEKHSLYKEEYDYDYEEELYLSGINDEEAKDDLLEILKGE